jgi:hypothetical protein
MGAGKVADWAHRAARSTVGRDASRQRVSRE